MKDAVEDPGGDLRAVEGTTAEVAIQTDKPLATGAIFLDDGSKIALRDGPRRHAGGQYSDPEGRPVPRGRGGRRRGRPAGRRLLHRSPEVPPAGSQDHRAPAAISRPRPSKRLPSLWTPRTTSASATSPCTTRSTAAPKRPSRCCPPRAPKPCAGSTVLAMEDFKVVPGDVVSIYAEAKDARASDLHRHLLHRGRAVRAQLHPVAGIRRRRWRRRRRRQPAERNLAARRRKSSPPPGTR